MTMTGTDGEDDDDEHGDCDYDDACDGCDDGCDDDCGDDDDDGDVHAVAGHWGDDNGDADGRCRRCTIATTTTTTTFASPPTPPMTRARPEETRDRPVAARASLLAPGRRRCDSARRSETHRARAARAPQRLGFPCRAGARAPRGPRAHVRGGAGRPPPRPLVERCGGPPWRRGGP